MSAYNHIIKSVVNEYHWTPHYIDDLYCDDIDHYGIIYWYNNILEMHKKIPKQNGS